MICMGDLYLVVVRDAVEIVRQLLRTNSHRVGCNTIVRIDGEVEADGAVATMDGLQVFIVGAGVIVWVFMEKVWSFFVTDTCSSCVCIAI